MDSVRDLITDENEIRSLLVSGSPLLDVRSPVEFEKGSLPGAINIPVLNDDERKLVGTTYKELGPEKAIELGRELVSGVALESRLAAWSAFVKANPNGAVYCFRGGMRSQSVQTVLREQGHKVRLVAGGFKRVRSLMMQWLDQYTNSSRLVVISGYTGAGKTEFLTRISSEGFNSPKLASELGKCHTPDFQPPGFQLPGREAAKFQTIDLEHLARHRGSAFGGMKDHQPSQVDFENALSLAVLRLPRPEGLTLVEDESLKVGRLDIPRPFFRKMSAAPLYVIEKPARERAKHLITTYLGDNDLIHNADPAKLEELRSTLLKNLSPLTPRLGGVLTRELVGKMHEAIEEQLRGGSWVGHIEWVEDLLVKYYDPYYFRHLEKNRERVVFRGSEEELIEALVNIC